MESINTTVLGTDTLQAEVRTVDNCIQVTTSDVITMGQLESPDDILSAFTRDHCDVTRGVSPSAIVGSSSVDDFSVPPISRSSPTVGEFSNFCTLEFCTPEVGDIQPLSVFSVCFIGTCECRHWIGDAPAQLKPCRADQFLFGPKRSGFGVGH